MTETLEKERIHLQEKLLEKLDYNRHLTDEEILKNIEDTVLQHDSERYLSVTEKRQLKRDLFNTFRRLDILSELLEDDEISEIMINGVNHIFIERKGVISETRDTFSNEERLRNVIQQIVSSCNRMVNETNPIVDARLEDGSRINIVLPPISLEGPIMTIRRFPKEFFTMSRLIQMGSITKEAADFLELLVKARYNIFISGGTGSGKTTMLNVLSNYIPADERVITIEDSAELQIRNIPNLVRLETRNANVEGENAIGMSQLIKTALRMRPDRIIIGEVRDAAAMDMTNSMLTGHDGSISTGHGNSAKEMLLRLETMILMGYDMPVLAIRQQLAAAIDVIIHIGRLRDNSRRVLEICEVVGVLDGVVETRYLFQFQEYSERDGIVVGMLERKGELENKRKLLQFGWKGEKNEEDANV